MNKEYIKLLILAYFREYDRQYSLTDLKNKLGISYKVLDVYISDLIVDEKLFYCQNYLSISKKGISWLMDSELWTYSYSVNIEKIYNKGNKVDLGYIYCVREFSKKKWWGSYK